MATASQLVLRARSTNNFVVLDVAEQLAANGYDWCAIAETFVGAAEDRARYCLGRALGEAGDDVRVYRNVARIQRRLGDDGAAAKALAVAAATFLAAPDTPSSSWALLADAWHLLGDRDAALDTLRHAAAFATTVEEHCDVAERAFDIGGPVELGAAKRLARSLREHAWLAKTCDYVQDLDGFIEHEEKSKLAFDAHPALSRTQPTQSVAMRPDDMLIESARNLGWPHAPAQLLDLLRRAIPRAQIERIAAGDYGMDYEAHLAALEAIVETGELVHPIQWEPGEVLALERWSEGDNVDHLARAFVCTCLCIDDAVPSSYGDGHESSIVVLLESCLCLGIEIVEAAMGLYAAMGNTYRDGVMRAFAEAAMLIAAAWRDAWDPRIRPTFLRAVHEEPELRAQTTRWAEGWLLGLTNFDMRHDLWKLLARTVLVDPIPHVARLSALLRNV